MSEFVENLDLVSPLKPRDAFFGGRTEAFKLYQSADEQNTVTYYDVTSLYPWVNKYGKYPVGHPSIITSSFEDIDSYEGIIKCKILPPRKLLIPVLPLKTEDKLLFPLCRTCAVNKQQTPCQHAEDNRALVGTWITDEVKKAILKGYRILQIYEVWHYNDVVQYDPATKSGGLFADYINTFAKVKQESSDWPSWCSSDEKKNEYIYNYYEKEGKT